MSGGHNDLRKVEHQSIKMCRTGNQPHSCLFRANKVKESYWAEKFTASI